MARKKKVTKLDLRKKPKDKLSKQSPYSWLTLDHPQLQKYVDHWYGKLEKEGFKDVEGGQRFSPYFASGAPTSWQYDDTRELYHRVLTNYLTFNPIKDRKLRLVAEMHNEGVGAFTISKTLRSRQYKKPTSVYWVHYQTKDLMKAAFEWNKTHEEGILTEDYETRNDAKIIEITLSKK